MDKQIQRIAGILYGPKVDITIDNRGLGRTIFNKMKKFKHRIMQIDATTEEQHTYEEINKKLIRIALEMKRRGIKADDVVLTCSYNSMDTILPIYSTLYLNAVTVTLDPSISLRESEHLLKTVSPKLIFVIEDAVDLVEKASAVLERKPEIVVMGSHKMHSTVSDFLRPHPNEDKFIPEDVDDIHNASNIFFSSGTTGLPKGILHSNYAMLHCSELFRKYAFLLNTAIFYTSFYWISAFIFTTATILTGGKRIYAGTFTPESFIKIVEKYKVDFSFLATTFARQFTEENTGNTDKSSLKAFFTGGSTISEVHVKNLFKYFPDAVISVGYGQTEIGGPATMFLGSDDHTLRLKPASCGFPFNNVKVKIVDPQTGKILGPMQKGEIRMKSDILFKGYVGASNNLENPLDIEGFLKTGDIGYYDEDNCLFFTDRLKEIFKYRSWHVVPASIEMIIYEHPAVLEAVVIGIPHEMDDNHPFSFVVLRNGYSITEEELLIFVNERVSDREKLRAGLRIVKKLPKTPTGKLARPQIRQIALSGKFQQLLC